MSFLRNTFVLFGERMGKKDSLLLCNRKKWPGKRKRKLHRKKVWGKNEKKKVTRMKYLIRRWVLKICFPRMPRERILSSLLSDEPIFSRPVFSSMAFPQTLGNTMGEREKKKEKASLPMFPCPVKFIASNYEKISHRELFSSTQTFPECEKLFMGPKIIYNLFSYIFIFHLVYVCLGTSLIRCWCSWLRGEDIGTQTYTHTHTHILRNICLSCV